MTAIDNRPKAHYRRDVRDSLGIIGGPNGFGEYLVAEEIVYDEESNTSTVHWRNLTAADLGEQR